MTVNEIMHKEVPIGESIIPVCEALLGTTVFIPITKESWEFLNQKPGWSSGRESTIQIVTGSDKYGRAWTYAYTTDEQLRSAMEDRYFWSMEMSFVEFFDMINRDEKYAGIILDSNRKTSFMYPIPREMFDAMGKLLQVH